MFNTNFKKVARPASRFGKSRPALIFICTFALLLSGVFFVYADKAQNEQVYYFLTDHLGSVDAILDEEGNVVERADYMPFGSDRVRQASDVSPDTDQQFTGKEIDDETGLYYYEARYYDPALGRFISFDPLLLNEGSKSLASVLKNPQALNGNAYVLNNPIRFIDETGEYTDEIHYSLTYYLGLIAGLDNGAAGEIAFFDDRMDTDPNTQPGANLENYVSGVTEKYHFVPRDEAVNRLQTAINAKDVRAFGKAMHTFQDTFSHEGLKPYQHAILTLYEKAGNYFGKQTKTDPDNTTNDILKATVMATSSFMAIREFKKNQLNLTDTDAIKAFDKESYQILNNNIGDIIQYVSFEIKSVSNIGEKMEEDNDDKK